MSDVSVHVVSPFGGSIAEVTRDLITGLKPHLKITEEGIEDPESLDILLCHFLNPTVTNDPVFKKFRKRVLIQPVDGTVFKTDVVQELNKFDLIITPGTGGKNILLDNKVTCKVEVIPNFYKNDIFSFDPKYHTRHIPDDKIVFYHESTFHPRKGIKELYQGYVKAFANTNQASEVLLVIKDQPFNKLTYDRNEELKKETIKLQNAYSLIPKIVKISQHLEWEQLKYLWHRANVYVSLAKIEGFGIPLLRMAALGKPILSLKNESSGYVDFLNSKNTYLVATEQVLASDEHMWLYDVAKTQWSIPRSEEELVYFFRLACRDCINKKSRLVDLESLKEMKYSSVIEKYVKVFKSL